MYMIWTGYLWTYIKCPQVNWKFWNLCMNASKSNHLNPGLPESSFCVVCHYTCDLIFHPALYSFSPLFLYIGLLLVLQVLGPSCSKFQNFRNINRWEPVGSLYSHYPTNHSCPLFFGSPESGVFEHFLKSASF